MSYAYPGGNSSTHSVIAESKTNFNDKMSASGVFKTVDGKTIEIRDVWASNLDQEMEIIRDLIYEKYHYVAMVSYCINLPLPPILTYSFRILSFREL